MKIPLSWLKDWIDTEQSPEQISETLTNLGLEVDKIDTIELPYSNVVVGKVLSTKPHPDAETLTVAQVTDGESEAQVVCGASNCREGITVAYAKIGAKFSLPDGNTLKIKKSKLRGVESHGMLCALEELGMEEKSDGIAELDETLPLGTPLEKLYGETVLDVSLTPNLGRCLSMLGVARELSAVTEKPIAIPHFSLEENEGEKIEDLLQITLSDKEKCPTYMCRAVKNVKVGPSPEWLQKRLTLSGINSVNNVVDVGNYVMLELGQPLHMFDMDTLSHPKLEICSQTTQKEMVAIDHKTYAIPEGALLITDSDRVLALGGIMGSEDSAVSDSTKNVIIEAAHFSPQSVRKTCKLTTLRSDASFRFERSIDPAIIPLALDRAAHLLSEIGGGETVSGTLKAGKLEPEKREIALRCKRVNQILGSKLGSSEIAEILSRLEIEIANLTSDDVLQCRIPSYRNDITLEIDLIEEVGRIYGYENLPSKPPMHISSSLPHSPIFLFENKVRGLMRAEGLNEWMTCSLVGPKEAALTIEKEMPESEQIPVEHPCSIDASILRTSLLTSMLPSLVHNDDSGNRSICAFEVGKVFFKENDEFFEIPSLGILLRGEKPAHHTNINPPRYDFFDLKGIIENLFDSLAITGVEYHKSDLENLHPHRQADLFHQGVKIGAFGEVHPSHLLQVGIKDKVYYAQLNLLHLMKLERKVHAFNELAKFPGSERDITLSLREDVSVGQLFAVVKKIPSKILEKFTLIDIYRNAEKLGENVKNATFRFSYRDKNKTLAYEKVEKEHARITQELAKNLSDCIVS